MKIVIVSGGKAPSLKLIKEELKDSSFLICADSGANSLYKYDIVPDYLMGDFDSIDEEAFKYFNNCKKCSIERFPSQKDFPDTELVVEKALEFKPDEIVLLGCTGTRVDHMMGSLGMLLKCLKLGVKCYIKDEFNTIQLTDKSIKLRGNRGDTFSLHAYCNRVENLSIVGAKYKLNNYLLNIGDGRCISNEFLNDEVDITFTSGCLLVFYSRD